MVKMMDKLLLFIFSFVILVLTIFIMLAGFGVVSQELLQDWMRDLTYRPVQIAVITIAVVLALLSIRFLLVSLKRDSQSAPSIDQKTDFGDIRISLETIENLALKAAARKRGVKDLKARVRVSEAGLDIVVRAVVDGETSIPVLTEEMQRSVKDYVEEICGVPVVNVSVFIANVVQTTTFKSRVE